MNGRVLHLPPVVTIHPKHCLVAPLHRAHELNVFFKMVALWRDVVSTVPNSTICAPINKSRFRFIATSRRR